MRGKTERLAEAGVACIFGRRARNRLGPFDGAWVYTLSLHDVPDQSCIQSGCCARKEEVETTREHMSPSPNHFT